MPDDQYTAAVTDWTRLKENDPLAVYPPDGGILHGRVVTVNSLYRDLGVRFRVLSEKIFVRFKIEDIRALYTTSEVSARIQREIQQERLDQIVSWGCLEIGDSFWILDSKTGQNSGRDVHRIKVSDRSYFQEYDSSVREGKDLPPSLLKVERKKNHVA